MSRISDILEDSHHRSFNFPDSAWIYYQEWNRVLFLHYEVPIALLRPLVPDRLIVDTFEDKAYISIVPFTMEHIRPRYLPSISFISDFNEINVRTYVEFGGKKGVYFLNIEAQKYLSVLVAKALSGLPYEHASINRKGTRYESDNVGKGFHLHAEYEVGPSIVGKSDLDNWLTERYCLYMKDRSSLYRYDIHHQEWNLKHVELKALDLQYHFPNLSIMRTADLAHYSDGIEVIAWRKIKI